MKKQRWYFIFCSLISIAIQLAIVVTSRIGALFNSAGLDTLFSWIVESVPLLLAVLGFLIVFISVHFLFYFFLYHVYRLATERFPEKGRQISYIFIFHGLVLLVLLAINAHFYPRSLFAWAAQPLLEQSTSQITLGMLFVFFGFFCLHAFWRFMHRVNLISRTKKWVVAASIVGMLFYQIAASHQYDGVVSHPVFKRPHVILIGVDSLRPDLVTDQLTPNLARIAEHSLVFSSAYTPIGRTFPAWVSILTGNYPIHNGARFNLTARDEVKVEDTLAKDLQSAGYRTMFAMDEKRFANIDESYGFDAIVGPRIGLSDFLLGSISDFPVLNLMKLLPSSRHLLPDSYANRAVSDVYQPESFDYLLKEAIPERPDSPLFLAVHFCLPHWPYDWADVNDYSMPDYQPGVPLDRNYIKAIKRADKQVADVLGLLKKRGYLEHAVVVFLSDHPESFYGGAAANAYDIGNGPVISANSAGHGMAVSRAEDSKILLMIKGYGIDVPSSILESDVAVSLIDIRPSILKLLGIHNHDEIDGKPLLMNSKNRRLHIDRPLFFETGLKLPAMKNNKIEEIQLIKSGIEYYDLNADLGRLELKKEHYQMLVDRKSLGILKDGWLLSFASENSVEHAGLPHLQITHADNRSISDSDAAREFDNLLPLLCEHNVSHPPLASYCEKNFYIVGGKSHGSN